MNTNSKMTHRENKEFNGEKIMNEVVERIAKSQKITEEITKTDDYMNWLESFTAKNIGFDYSGVEDSAFEMQKEDQEKIEKLGNFYEAINAYATKNYIYGKRTNYGNQYCIKHNGIRYEIGMLSGQGTVFSIYRQNEQSKNEDNCIDFELIKNNKLMPRTEIIRTKLVQLDNMIRSLIEENIPAQAIEETTQKSLKKFK